MHFTIVSLPILLYLLFIIESSMAIINGRPVEWNDYGWLVKVLARDKDGRTTNCLGTRLSSALIITSARCAISQTGEKIDQFAVVVPKLSETKAQYFSGTLLARSQDNNWALLQVQPQNLTKLCPHDSFNKYIMRLAQAPSTFFPLKAHINAVLLNAESCFLVGFETANKSSEFINSKEVRRITTGMIRSPASERSLHWTKVYKAARSTTTACLDDVGAALICEVAAFGNLQLGIFQTLTVMGNEQLEEGSLDICTKAQEMEFSLLISDNELVEAIQKHNHMGGFSASYNACKFD